MLINIQYTYRFRTKLCECTRRMIFLCLLSIKECMMHMIHIPFLKDKTTVQVEFRTLTVSYYDKSEAWTIFLLREFYFTLYLYMCFISRGRGHGLVGKVPTSKHENLNPITDAHIKSMYLHQSTGRQPAGQSVQSNQLAFSSVAIPVSKE